MVFSFFKVTVNIGQLVLVEKTKNLQQLERQVMTDEGHGQNTY
jgi:hypothetical protein